MALVKGRSLGLNLADTFNFTGTLQQNGGAIAGGKLLQVVSAKDTTARTTNSTSYVTGSNTLSVNITPSSSSNKILILTSYQHFGVASQANCRSTVFRTIGGSATDLATVRLGQDYNGHTISVSSAYEDSPSTTSQCTYQVYFKSGSGSHTVRLNAPDGSDTVDGSIVAMEISS
tara:strand:- start:181 stop:702 length:522 start_codon:yes stop_codon:yes gene_type:complete